MPYNIVSMAELVWVHHHGDAVFYSNQLVYRGRLQAKCILFRLMNRSVQNGAGLVSMGQNCFGSTRDSHATFGSCCEFIFLRLDWAQL